MLANDSDPDGDLDPNSLSVVEQPVFGSAEIVDQGVSYTPDPDVFGQDAFTYQVCDAEGNCASARVSIAIAAVDDPPVVAADAATTEEDIGVAIAVLANDSDADGDLDPSTLAIVDGPDFGTVAIVDTNAFFTPGPDLSGVDTFSYEVCDAAGLCGVALVTVDVTAVNDAPVAMDDSATGERGRVLTIDVLANDGDIDSPPPVIAGFDPVSALGGTVFCVTECVYTPPEPWPGDDTFTYAIVDAEGAMATATVTVTPDVPDVVLYLRSVGPGDQKARPVLPLSAEAGPSNDALPNYDTDRDDRPGLFLLQVDGGAGPQLAETDLTRYQIWATPADGELVLSGEGQLTVWAATAGFEPGIDARIRTFLLDCPGPTVTGTECQEIARAQVTRRPWTQLPDTFERGVIDYGRIDYTIPAGHVLAVKLTVAGPNSDDDLHIAYDANGLLMSLVIAEVPIG